MLARIRRPLRPDPVDHDRDTSTDPDDGEQDMDRLEHGVPVVRHVGGAGECEDDPDDRDASENPVGEVGRVA